MIRSARGQLLSGCGCCTRTAKSMVSRRAFVAASGMALGALATGSFAANVRAQARPHRIDVHHHISPPTWIAAVC